jgi:hypothetical protein
MSPVCSTKSLKTNGQFSNAVDIASKYDLCVAVLRWLIFATDVYGLIVGMGGNRGPEKISAHCGDTFHLELAADARDNGLSPTEDLGLCNDPSDSNPRCAGSLFLSVEEKERVDPAIHRGGHISFCPNYFNFPQLSTVATAADGSNLDSESFDSRAGMMVHELTRLLDNPGLRTNPIGAGMIGILV